MSGAEQPLLHLEGLSRHYPSGDTVVKALDAVSLDIYAGEFVAIMGQSGSGKTTLMNMIGLLDTPTSGAYQINGRDVAGLDRDERARLRSRTFGFIYQRYNLLDTASAQENVELPAIYAGFGKVERAQRAGGLLDRLGLEERKGNRPNALSGGQQQRVAIARALVNDPAVILADEPTGALDSRSGEEVMALLKTLNAEGRTIILITHDEKVAAHADRQIHIADGRIVKESKKPKVVEQGFSTPALTPPQGEGDFTAIIALPLTKVAHIENSLSTITVESPSPWGGVRGGVGEDKTRVEANSTAEIAEAVKMAIRALWVNKFRTFLTLLGIIIGVASVIVMLAVGTGSKQKVLDQITAMGTNLIMVRPGAPGMRPSGDVSTLTVEDANAIAALPNVRAVVPERSGRYTVRRGPVDVMTSVRGTNAYMPSVNAWPVVEGTSLSELDDQRMTPVAMIGQTVKKNLFPDGESPVGQTILIKNIPFEIVAVMGTKGASMFGSDQDDVVFIPLSTGMVRLFGRSFLNHLVAQVEDFDQIERTQEAIGALLLERHRVEDFSVRNMASFIAMASETQNTLTLLLGAVAAISLLVGGIGVMNIMLVSVTERTREIGVRIATGARTRDILLQFMTESVVVCLTGGALGVFLGIVVAMVVDAFGMRADLTVGPMALAFTCAVSTGLVFGYLPARKAAFMDPVVALASE